MKMDAGKGWNVAMATAGFERGVSLRSPARFTTAADRLINLWREVADPTDEALSDAVVDAVSELSTYLPASAPARLRPVAVTVLFVPAFLLSKVAAPPMTPTISVTGRLLVNVRLEMVAATAPS